MTRSRKIRIRRWIERCLLFGGVVGVGIWLWSYVSQTAFQDSANRDFESEMEDHETTLIAPPAQQAPGPGAQPRSVPTNSVVGRLRIPRLHLSTMIREGVDEKTLSLAPGHI